MMEMRQKGPVPESMRGRLHAAGQHDVGALNYVAAADLQAKTGKDVKEAEAQTPSTGHEGAASVGTREAVVADGRDC